MPEPSIVFPLILFVVICLLVGSFIFLPMRSAARGGADRESERIRCVSEKEDVLKTIRDLDFDFQTGKLAEADYQALRNQAENRGIALLRRLDELTRPAGAEELEAEIVRMRDVIRRESGHA